MELAAVALSLTSLKYVVPIGSSVPPSLGHEMVLGYYVSFIPQSVIVPQYEATLPTSQY
jgi:hypothetical protein